MQPEDLIARYMNLRTKVHGFIWSLTGDYQISEDIFQEVSIIILKQYQKFEPGTHFDAWVMEIARRTAMERRRKSARGLRNLSESALKNLQDAFTVLEQDDLLHHKREALRTCLGQIRQEERALLETHYVAHRPLGELAGNLGISVEALRSRFRRVRKVLSQCVMARLRGEPV